MATPGTIEHDDLAGLEPVERRIVECKREFGQDARFSWMVHRLAENGAESLCETVHGEVFDEDSFRKRWGAGHYRRRLRCKGKRAHLAQEDFSLEPIPGAPDPTHAPQPAQHQTAQQAPQLGVMPAPAGGDLFGSILAMTMQQQQLQAQQAQAQQQSQMMLMVELLKQQNRTPVADLVELMGVVKKTAQDSDGGDDSLAATIGPMLAAMQNSQSGAPVDPNTAQLAQQLAAIGITTPQQLGQLVQLARKATTDQAKLPDPTLSGQLPRQQPEPDTQPDADQDDDGPDLGDAAAMLMVGARKQSDPGMYAMLLDDALADRIGDAYPALIESMPTGSVAQMVEEYDELTDDDRAWLGRVELALRAMQDTGEVDPVQADPHQNNQAEDTTDAA